MEFIIFLKVALINLVLIVAFSFIDRNLLDDFTDRYDNVETACGVWAVATLVSLIVLAIWAITRL